ncbi:MAG: hypothetical protein WD734_02300 [Dehalococcoidia bacterium]
MFDIQPSQRMYNSIISRGTRAVPTYSEVKRDARESNVERYTLGIF